MRFVLSLTFSLCALAGNATADELTAAQIAERAAHDGAPSSRVCHIDVVSTLTDSKGHATNQDVLDVEETQRGGEHTTKSVSHMRDGHLLTPAEREVEWKKREERRKGRKDMEASPLSASQFATYEFTLLRREELWGHPAYVLRVEPRQPSAEAVRGTAWVDAERFIELKGEYAPAKMPDHVVWLKVQVQADRDAHGLVHPTFFKIEGAGKMMFIRRNFHTEMRWRDCRAL